MFPFNIDYALNFHPSNCTCFNLRKANGMLYRQCFIIFTVHFIFKFFFLFLFFDFFLSTITLHQCHFTFVFFSWFHEQERIQFFHPRLFTFLWRVKFVPLTDHCFSQASSNICSITAKTFHQTWPIVRDKLFSIYRLDSMLVH